MSSLVPAGLTIDSFAGDCWVSLVAFTMEKIRPRYLPAVPFISDFPEINVRTYVVHDDKPGVYFLNIESGKPLSTFIAKFLSGLPYENASMGRHTTGNVQWYSSNNPRKRFALTAGFTVGEEVVNKSLLDQWLTERYCLYLNEGNKVYRYQIHHQPWPLFRTHFSELDVDYRIGDISLNHAPDFVHFSSGVKVVAWGRENCERA